MRLLSAKLRDAVWQCGGSSGSGSGGGGGQRQQQQQQQQQQCSSNTGPAVWMQPLLTDHIATNFGSRHVVFQYGSGARFALWRSDRMSPGTVAASEVPLLPPPTFTAAHAPSRYTGADDEAMAWSRSVTGSACPNATPVSATSMSGI
eukprot:COSAG05_NODE_251_length_12871_cov_4.691669_14_plen_147_part_00